MLNNSFKPVPTTLLQQLATQSAITPATVTTQPAAAVSAVHSSPHNAVTSGVNPAANSQQWLDDWCSQYAPETNFRPWQGGGRIAIVECLTNPDHKGKAYITQQTNGAISAGCQHASCKWNWADFRTARQPNLPPKPVAATSITPSTIWETPETLELASNAPLPEIDEVLIPEPLLSYAKNVRYRMQTSYEYIMTTLFVSLSGLLNNKIFIYTKKNDTWRVVANLWGMIVGSASTLKTPVINEVTQNIKVIANKLAGDFKQDGIKHATDIKLLDAQIKSLKVSLKTSGVNQAAVQQQIDVTEFQLEQLKANPPTRKRITVKDVTIEKLIEILTENPDGLLLFMDELVNFFVGLNKPGREESLGVYLESWNGTNAHDVDRIGRGSLSIDKLCLSILGTIQPSVLLKIAKQFSEKHGQNGLFPRFQLVFFPPKLAKWEYTDCKPDAEAEQQLKIITDFIYAWRPSKDKNYLAYRQDVSGDIGVSFDASAQQLFQDWLTEFKNREDYELELMNEHMGKYTALMPKLALLFHVIIHASSGSIPPLVNKETALRAIVLCEVLEPHAQYLYGLNKAMKKGGQTETAIALLGKVKAGSITSGATINTIVRHNWSKLNDIDVVTEAVELLAEKKWLRQVSKPADSKGRPTMTIELHPQIQQYLGGTYVIKTSATPRPTPYLDKLKAMLNSPKPQATSFDDGDYLAMLALVGGSAPDDNVDDSTSQHFNMIQFITNVRAIEEQTVAEVENYFF